METWIVAVSTEFDTLWRSSIGRDCVTDGTHPKNLDDDVEHYVIDEAKLSEPVVIGKGIGKFPEITQFSCRRAFKSHRLMQDYFIAQGVISKPITYLLGE